MLDSYLMAHPVAAAAAWVVLYTSDYYLTLWGSKLFRSQSIIRYESSYEMQPEYQDDVENARRISPSFVVWLMLGAAALLLSPFATGLARSLYALLAGALIVPEIAAQTRHLENIAYCRRLGSPTPGVTGSITCSPLYSYRKSASNTLLIGALILTGAAFGDSLMLVGGGIFVVIQATAQYLASRQMSAPPAHAKAAGPDSEPQPAETEARRAA